MTTPTETLDNWLSDAKKATQGEWNQQSVEFGFGSHVAVSGESIVVCERNKHPGINNARHIANACPQNFAALIEELLQLRSMTHKDEWKKVNIRGVEVEVLGVKNDATE